MPASYTYPHHGTQRPGPGQVTAPVLAMSIAGWPSARAVLDTSPKTAGAVMADQPFQLQGLG